MKTFNKEDKEAYKILLSTPSNHTKRLKHYFERETGLNINTIQDYLFIKDVQLPKFLERLRKDEARIWRYINRVYPFEYRSKEYGDVTDFDFEGKTIRVVAYPRDLQKRLLKDIEEELLNPKTFTHFLSCVKIDGEYFYGLYPSDLHYKKPVEEENEKPTSRAHYKILESTKIFNISLKSDWRVLDIGSAPGGWIQYLKDRVKSITAVDPAGLHIEIPENTLYIKDKVENSYKELQEQGKFDLVTCDINKDPKETVEILKELTELIKPEGHIIMTIKLVYKGEEGKRKLINNTREALENDFKNIQVEWLPANSKNERTVHAVKK